MASTFGEMLREESMCRPMMCFIGVYDAFSASIAAHHFDGLFLSGFSFAASYYGLPDVGFVAWPDMVAFCQRVRAIHPTHHIIVDMDDGYGDAQVAGHVVTLFESAGASGIIMEDQRRPRRCGHADGKQVLDLDEYLVKLERVLWARRDLFVIARTDATSDAERVRRARAFDQVGADAILIDGLADLTILRMLADEISTPLMFNQIAGGKSPPCSLSELTSLGVSLVNYSTPCLFASMDAIAQAMAQLRERDGQLPTTEEGAVDVAACNRLLETNVARNCNPKVGVGAPIAHAVTPSRNEE